METVVCWGGGCTEGFRDEENKLTPTPIQPWESHLHPLGDQSCSPQGPPKSWLGLRGHGRTISPLAWAHLWSWAGGLSGVGTPWGAPVLRGAGGHAGGWGDCPWPCCNVSARAVLPPPGAKCPGEAGLEAGGGVGRSPRCPEPTSLPASLPAAHPSSPSPSQASGPLQPPRHEEVAPHPWGHSPLSTEAKDPWPWRL